jgi:hypothetical protein
VLTKPYGRVFLEALPEAKRFVDEAEEGRKLRDFEPVR